MVSVRGVESEWLPLNHNIAWEQGRSLLAPICCVTGLGEIVERIAMLLLAGSDDRHNPLGETTSGLALSAEAAVTPKHSRTDLPFT